MRLFILLLLLAVHSQLLSARRLYRKVGQDDDLPLPTREASVISLDDDEGHGAKTNNATVDTLLNDATVATLQQRRLEEVEELTNNNCRLTTSLKTPTFSSGGIGNAKGIMFNLQSSSDVELLSLEFGVLSSSSSSVSVEVYIKQGSFSGFQNVQSQWTSLAFAQAKLSPDSNTAIIPANQFQSYSMSATTEYAIYVSMLSTGILQTKASSKSIDATLHSNDILTTNVGVLLTEGPFPVSLGSVQGTEFQGVLHYNHVKACSDLTTTTDVPLEFAINSDPGGSVLTALSQTVQSAMESLMSSNPTLSQYKNNDSLTILQVTSNFVGRSEEKCPTTFDNCALVTSTIAFQHLQSLESPLLLSKNVVAVGDELGVTNSNSVSVAYVGSPVLASRMILTLEGISQKLSTLQESYLEQVSSQFFSEFTTSVQIYQVQVIEQSTVNDRRLLRGGREYQRQLQASGLEIAVDIYGSSESLEYLQTAILDAISSNKDRYVDELALQHLRPGAINNNGNDFGSIFDDISDIQVRTSSDGSSPTTDNNGESSPTASPIGNGSGGGGSGQDDESLESIMEELWLPLSIAGVAISGLFLIVRIYLDCFYSPKIVNQKLVKGVSNFHESERSGPPSWRDNHGESERSRRVYKSREKQNNDKDDIKSKSFPPPTKIKRSQSGDQVKQMKESLGKNKSGEFQKSKASKGDSDPKPTRTKLKRAHSDDQVRQMALSLKKDDDDAPKNRAGQNGRGIKPSRSLPMGDSTPHKTSRKVARRPSNPSERRPESISKMIDSNPKRSVPRSRSLAMGQTPSSDNSDEEFDSRSVSGPTPSKTFKRSKKKGTRALSPKRQAQTTATKQQTISPKKSPKRTREVSPKRDTKKPSKSPAAPLSPKKDATKNKKAPNSTGPLSPKKDSVHTPALPKRGVSPKRNNSANKQKRTLSPKRKVTYVPKNRVVSPKQQVAPLNKEPKRVDMTGNVSNIVYDSEGSI